MVSEEMIKSLIKTTVYYICPICENAPYYEMTEEYKFLVEGDLFEKIKEKAEKEWPRKARKVTKNPPAYCTLGRKGSLRNLGQGEDEPLNVGRTKPAQFRQDNPRRPRICRNCVARGSLLPAYFRLSRSVSARSRIRSDSTRSINRQLSFCPVTYR